MNHMLKNVWGGSAECVPVSSGSPFPFSSLICFLAIDLHKHPMLQQRWAQSVKRLIQVAAFRIMNQSKLLFFPLYKLFLLHGANYCSNISLIPNGLRRLFAGTVYLKAIFQ